MRHRRPDAVRQLGSYLGMVRGSGQSESLSTAIVGFLPPLVLGLVTVTILGIRLETFTGFLSATAVVLGCAVVWGLALRWARRRRSRGR